MRLFGQTFTASMIGRIRAAAAEPGVTRSALSRRVCEWLDWHDINGKPKEVSSRKALVELERRGLISLPEAQRVVVQERCAAPIEPFPAPVYAGPLEALGAVELVAVEDRALSSPSSVGWRATVRGAAALPDPLAEDWLVGRGGLQRRGLAVGGP